ncbi:MAG: hypothetical protein FWG62_02290 [Proteobacteria bacterium]|nr:hypothetical protein [Pseudomonadota bacterium]
MKIQSFNNFLLSCRDRIQGEVSALLGKPFSLGAPGFRQVSKDELFFEVSGKAVLVHASLEGELRGAGCVLAGIEDAITIGGTLLMMPDAALDATLAAQNYSEDLPDSYKEVVNIICGAFTAIFAERYPKSVRLVSGGQEIVVPAQVKIASDLPIPDVPYYLMTTPMQLGERQLGPLRLVLPAIPLELDSSAGVDAQSDPAAAKTALITEEADALEQPVEHPGRAAEAAPADPVEAFKRPTEGQSPASAPGTGELAARLQKAARQKALVDELLKGGMTKMCDEVSALLGGSLKVAPAGNRPVTKKEFLDQAEGKLIMTRMEIRGDEHPGEAYLFINNTTAIYLGGTLLMLPESELAETVKNEDFGDDVHDAYGEVANIIAGVCTTFFGERYPGKFGLVMTEIEQIVPGHIDPNRDEVLPAQPYYLSTNTIQYNDRDLGPLQLLIPAGALALEDAHLLDTAVEPVDESRPEPEAAASAGQPAAVSRLQEQPEESPDVLLFTDDGGEAERIARMLTAMGYTSRILHFKDPVHSVLTPRIRIAFLIMREASELGFGVAIKISSAGLAVPLVAAGPAWTKTLVLKAVKYGACDILITPASPEDIQEKMHLNLVKKAA